MRDVDGIADLSQYFGSPGRDSAEMQASAGRHGCGSQDQDEGKIIDRVTCGGNWQHQRRNPKTEDDHAKALESLGPNPVQQDSGKEGETRPRESAPEIRQVPAEIETAERAGSRKQDYRGDKDDGDQDAAIELRIKCRESQIDGEFQEQRPGRPVERKDQRLFRQPDRQRNEQKTGYDGNPEPVDPNDFRGVKKDPDPQEQSNDVTWIKPRQPSLHELSERHASRKARIIGVREHEAA